MGVIAKTHPASDGHLLREITLQGPEATDRLGAALARALEAGDTVLLSGDLGAGKSALARAVIRARLGQPEAEVPSPTYTLINVYEPAHPGAAPIWHADLYRLGGVDDLAELGLEDAFDTTITLIEWPDRLGPLIPERHLAIALGPADDDDARRATITANGGRWGRAAAAVARFGAGA